MYSLPKHKNLILFVSTPLYGCSTLWKSFCCFYLLWKITNIVQQKHFMRETHEKYDTLFCSEKLIGRGKSHDNLCGTETRKVSVTPHSQLKQQQLSCIIVVTVSWLLSESGWRRTVISEQLLNHHQQWSVSGAICYQKTEKTCFFNWPLHCWVT